MKAYEYFTQEKRDQVKAVIQEFEQKTSGEIRVHVEDFCNENVLDHASFLFNKLEMQTTASRNGVLFYLSFVDHKVAVIGDIGINNKVSNDFWNDVLVVMQKHFKAGSIIEGLVIGIKLAGEQLAKHFPYDAATDQNELSDEISFGE